MDGLARLQRRKWLIDNFDYLFEQVLYYRLHKEMFMVDPITWWSWDDEFGTLELHDITERSDEVYSTV